MTDRLPPLLWVRVFEAAARHSNFVTAAKQLSVTPAAVSRTIRELEDFMGVALFVRKARGVELTAAARKYALAIGPAIRQIAQASTELRIGAQHETIRVTALPALAQCWLVPRLGAFNQLHPDISVMVSADSTMVDLSQSAFDLALRYGSPHAPHCESIELFREELFPVLSPKLAAKAALRTPRDLFQLPALHDTGWETDWSLWLGAVGLAAPERWRGSYFSLYAMAVDAAIAGQGVLMGHGALIADSLRNGTLVAPFSARISSPKRYYAIVRSDQACTPAVGAFLSWLHSLSETSIVAAA